jgi:hypothetical protein
LLERLDIAARGSIDQIETQRHDTARHRGRGRFHQRIVPLCCARPCIERLM